MVLPKFKIESDVKLSDHLTKMGIIDLFHSNQADLIGRLNVQVLLIDRTPGQKWLGWVGGGHLVKWKT